MLLEDSKEIYKEVENRLLSVSENGSFFKNDLFAPLRIVSFGVGSTNFNSILFRFVVYLLLSLILYALILNFFRGIIPDALLAMFFYPLTVLFPSLFSLLAPPSDSAFLRTSKYELIDAAEIIKKKRAKSGQKMTEEYLSGLKEIFQLIEKDANQRNSLVKSLLAGIYLVGIYLLGVVSKLPVSGSFTIWSTAAFLLFYLLVECHSGVKDKIFSVLYSVIAEIKLELKDEESKQDNFITAKTGRHLLSVPVRAPSKITFRRQEKPTSKKDDLMARNDSEL